MAVPCFIPFIFPVSLTVIIFSLLDSYVIFSPHSFSPKSIGKLYVSSCTTEIFFVSSNLLVKAGHTTISFVSLAISLFFNFETIFTLALPS